MTVAQAFHWFDAVAAISEIHRVLRGDGGLALLWNTRVEADPVNQAIDAIVAPYRDGSRGHGSVSWYDQLERTNMFGALEQRTFANSQTLDADGLAARVGSMSYVAAQSPRERERVLAQVAELTAAGPVSIRYMTEVYVADRHS